MTFFLHTSPTKVRFSYLESVRFRKQMMDHDSEIKEGVSEEEDHLFLNLILLILKQTRILSLYLHIWQCSLHKEWERALQGPLGRQ